MTVPIKDIEFLIAHCHQLSTLVNPPQKNSESGHLHGVVALVKS